MGVFHKILIPTDLSDCARVAIPTAVALCRDQGAELFVVHVIPPPEYPAEVVHKAETFEDMLEAMREHSTAELKRLREKDIGPEVKVQTMVTEGPADDAIIDAAERVGADLIVMATHGHSGFRRLWLGSTADRVVRAAHCPVLLVGPETASIT